MPFPSNNSSASNTIAEMPASEVIDDGIARTAATDCDDHISPPSMLKGWDLLFSCLPTILLTKPMGIVADRYGMKMLLFVTLGGLTLATAWMQIVSKF